MKLLLNISLQKFCNINKYFFNLFIFRLNYYNKYMAFYLC
jgi:hypothetical protein